MGKDLSYLQFFTFKSLREAKRILSRGFTAKDIDTFLGNDEPMVMPKSMKKLRRLPRGAKRQILANTKFGRKRP